MAGGELQIVPAVGDYSLELSVGGNAEQHDFAGGQSTNTKKDLFSTLDNRHSVFFNVTPDLTAKYSGVFRFLHSLRCFFSKYVLADGCLSDRTLCVRRGPGISPVCTIPKIQGHTPYLGSLRPVGLLGDADYISYLNSAGKISCINIFKSCCQDNSRL